MIHFTSTIENGDRGEDRIVVRRTPDGVVVVVADGAGGVGGGLPSCSANSWVNDMTGNYQPIITQMTPPAPIM